MGRFVDEESVDLSEATVRSIAGALQAVGKGKTGKRTLAAAKRRLDPEVLGLLKAHLNI